MSKATRAAGSGHRPITTGEVYAEVGEQIHPRSFFRKLIQERPRIDHMQAVLEQH